MSKRILIDGYNLALENGTGIATYARELSHAAHALGHRVDILYGVQHRSAELVLQEIAGVSPQARKKRSAWAKFRVLQKHAAGVNAESIPHAGRLDGSTCAGRLPYFDRLWNAPELYDRARIGFDFYRRPIQVAVPEPPDIAHWTYLIPARVKDARNVYTIHDLVPLRLPFATTDKNGRFLSLSRALASSADHIVTVSECSRRDIVELLGVPEQRVTNTYQAVCVPGEILRSTDEQVRSEVEDVLQLPFRGYMMYFGAIEPKKNVRRLIQAHLASGVRTPLILVGKLGWQYDEELALIERHAGAGAEARVRRIDYVERSQLYSLIRAAKAVLFPSLYEGFGLPVAEAMQLGTPVMTSTAGSLPEIAGGAALLVDPHDVEAMAKAIRALDADEAMRGELSSRGREQAKKFSRDAYGLRLAKLYSQL